MKEFAVAIALIVGVLALGLEVGEELRVHVVDVFLKAFGLA